MTAPSANRAKLVLAVLFLSTFVMGVTELLVPGVLNLIAADLGVSIQAAGMLVTAQALGVALGGPLLTALTVRLTRRVVLAGTIAVFIVANLVLVLSSDYGLVVAARALGGAVGGLFIAAAFQVGTSIVPAERMGRAISVVLSGTTVSAALGVPLGTWAGQALGWRGSFLAIVVLSALVLVAVLALVPRVPAGGRSIGDQARYAFAPRVLAVLVVIVLVFAALFAALTYIAPFLERVTGVPGTLISLFLLAYGVATAVGSFGGGRFADANAPRALILGTGGLAVALLVLYLAGTVAALVVLALLALGVFGMGTAPVVQYRVVGLAGPGAQLAQSLPASSANLGVALGAAVGGVAVGRFSVIATMLSGCAFACAAVVIAWGTRLLTPPTTRDCPLDGREPVQVDRSR
ncbi:MFS transporter [Actinocatenispora rupis]|uniref:MFS transporter n=1 Tax=Actinocatenispora rupis TaxID=519421 RepID=A0A8J3J262_9ACTN|nr:MFS transporter [Actinocatenispora rupis]GID10171.1 MFS transporter [Actinocatenispora rupis]